MDQKQIRNFCIIAHIDHGKSTLADRLLEVTATVDRRKMRSQILDSMDLERERGITIKLQPVRMIYNEYELNLIDTPGHVDFSYEVSRSLAACEGAVLVVDATQGIQAQTLANVNLALEHGLKIIPVINKIDLPNADPQAAAEEIKEVLGFSNDQIVFVSAKTGENVEAILEKIIAEVPPPSGDDKFPLRALIFDSSYDRHRGVIVYIRVVDGVLRANDALKMIAVKQGALALEIGYFAPELRKDNILKTGEVGYIVTNLRKVENARVGDTVVHADSPNVSPLPGYKQVNPMVYASIFPSAGDDYPRLRDAMEKLKLNDASLVFEPESSPSLGFGFRSGFLGLLHMDIVSERLHREFDLDLVVTMPSVTYKIKKTNSEEETIYTPSQLPDQASINQIFEPWISLDVLTPEKCLGGIMTILKQRRGFHVRSEYLGHGRLRIHFEAPLANIINDFYDKLKSVSSGYASMNYEFIEFRPADLVRLDVLVAGEVVEPLSLIVARSEAESEGRRIVSKLKELVPRQQFPVAIQAAVGSKIIARETISALRKDVTAKLYGGDVTRKMKLLKKQKEGKKRMGRVGKVEIPKSAFLDLLKR